MKEFLKMLGASFTAMVVYGIICIMILIGAVSGFASKIKKALEISKAF